MTVTDGACRIRYSDSYYAYVFSSRGKENNIMLGVLLELTSRNHGSEPAYIL